MKRRTVRVGGVFGLFTREGVEVTGYISTDLRYASGGSYAARQSGQAGLPGETGLPKQPGPPNPPLDVEEERK
jgi:flagellar biosynthesis protein FlhF